MASPDARAVAKAIEDAGARIAHAVRRSTALEQAILLSEPGTDLDTMLATASRLATWINGEVGARADLPPADPGPRPWEER